MDQHSDYIPAEEHRCPECHRYDMTQTHFGRAKHFSTCSKATIQDLRFWLDITKKDYTKQILKGQERIQTALLWEAKYRTVKHENNQLRKKVERKAVKASTGTPKVAGEKKPQYRILEQDERVLLTDEYHHDGCWYELNAFEDHPTDEGKQVREFDDLIFRRLITD